MLIFLEEKTKLGEIYFPNVTCLVNGGGRIKSRFVLDFKAIFILLFNIGTMKWVIMQMRTSMCTTQYTSALACFHCVNTRDFRRGCLSPSGYTG